ncbi:MAG TPA: methyl-accepting chemotaxis protein [Spirochaetia bacterium]|nr:methyl-accepting chemotaxis protein [Spirochaetales bacterium]HRY79028.1 methyl-accepting chemotaxis protein [Spirochaetia bacterium]
MKKHRNANRTERPVLAAALTAILAAGSAATGLAVPGLGRPAAAASAALALLAAAVGLRAYVSVRKASRGDAALQAASSDPERGALDLVRLAAAASEDRSLAWHARLLETLNQDIALLQRSAVKFDLFSSDILFSAQTLAGLARRDLEMLTRLRGQVTEFFEEQARTNEELGQLRERLTGSAELAARLARTASDSRSELSLLVDLSREAARDARAGVEGVEATGEAASGLERLLDRLNQAARREAEEADRIAESLARIADIVERTHILATNASIEAARAGARGSGFAVIAAEVRNLSEASRKALEDIGKVLGSVAAGIRESGALSAQVASHSEQLDRSLSRTRSSFEAIDGRIREVEGRLARFDEVFSEQAEGSNRSSASAGQAASLLEGFAVAFRERTETYEGILEAARESETSVHDAERSARVLAQLAGYLKNGGLDRNRVLRRYRADGDLAQGRLGRRERREELLYNLEIFDPEGASLGHLGDLSPSGLLLVTPGRIEPGTRLALSLALPITAEGERRVPLSVTVRRVEEDGGLFRHGCSIDDRERAAGQVEEILRSLSLGAVSAPGLPAAGAGSPGAEEVEEAEEV